VFITFEGNNGVGKSTQIELLKKRLEECGEKVVVTREPGGNGVEVAEKIRSFLREYGDMHAMTELLLLFASRNEHYQKFIRPKLDDGFTVICDRFYDSSIVFQGVLNDIRIDDIMKLKHIALGDFEPDLTILLDLSYADAVSRISTRNDDGDKYDLISCNQFETIRAAYLKLSEIFYKRCVVIKANSAPARTAEKVFRAYKMHRFEEVN